MLQTSNVTRQISLWPKDEHNLLHTIIAEMLPNKTKLKVEKNNAKFMELLALP
jgi:hypothetical protein